MIKIKFKVQSAIIFLTAIYFFFLICGCRSLDKGMYYSAPSMLPWTAREMKTPGFWISRHLYPDKVILNSQEIEQFNSYIESELKLIRDVSKIGSIYSGANLISDLNKDLNSMCKQKLYIVIPDKSDCKFADKLFYRQIKEEMNFNSIPFEIKVQYGFIIHYADQRILPVEEGLYAKAGAMDFDELQNSALDIGTPVAILHNSRDEKWVYVLSPLTSGWVKRDEIVFCELGQLKNFVDSPSFLVVTNPKADIFLDSSLTEHYDYVRMGVKLPVKENNIQDDTITAFIPFREADGRFFQKLCYVKREDVNLGYLVYTPRTIIQQAFKLLNAPYGWGGMYGEQDCSRFIQEIFAVAGISLPRNSSEQRQIGMLLELPLTLPSPQRGEGKDEERKVKTLSQEAIGGITTLYLKGHIMLFLGMVENRPYAISAIWAYRQKMNGKDIARVINRVALTELSLGKGSKKGSLLERLIAVRVIK